MEGLGADVARLALGVVRALLDRDRDGFLALWPRVVRMDGSARAADAVFMVAARRTRRRIDGVNGGAIDARTSRRSNIDQCNFSRVMSASNELDVDGSLQK